MNLDAELYLAPESRCGAWGHAFLPHELLGLACGRCGTVHVCPDCNGVGEHERTGLCRSCDGVGCRCKTNEDHAALLLAVNSPVRDGDK